MLYIHNADFSNPSANKIQVLNMCKAFKKVGQDITLMSFNCNKDTIKNVYGENVDFNLTSLKPSGNYYIRSLLLFLKFLKLKDDYSWIYTRDLIFAFLVTRFFRNKKVIYELHEIINNKLWRQLFRLTFPYLQKLVVISWWLKKELSDLGYDLKKVIVLHDGVDLEKFNINLSKEKAREKLSLPLDKKIIVYAWSLKEWKGYKIFLESYKFLSNKDNVLYILVWGTENEIKILKSKFPKNVLFYPFVNIDKVVYFLKAADILILPNSAKYKISVKYTSPLKLFEYMASKTPIIASKLPSIKEILTSNEVLFFKPDDSIDLANKIEILLWDTNLWLKLWNNAYRKVLAYTWDNRAKFVLDIFNK